MQKKYFPIISAATALAFLMASGFAEAAVPSAAEPARVPGQIAPVEAPRSTEGGGGLVSSGHATRAPAGAEKVKFTLVSVKIDNMTAYRESEMSLLYQDMLGKTISLADVYELADRMTAKYRNDGFVLTQVVIPPQTIKSGNIRYRVVEGFVDNVTVQGQSGGDMGVLREYVDKIKAAKPLNSKVLERYLLLINDLPGISAKIILSPSAKTPGASDIALVVDRKPYDLFFQADNRGSRYLGPLQLNAGTRLNNMLGSYEGITFQAVTAPDGTPHRELDYVSLGIDEPVGSEGTKVTVSGSHTKTHPGFNLTADDVRGIANAYNIEVMHPFIRSRNENLYARVKFNYLNTRRTDNLGLGAMEDRLRILRLSSTYQVTDRFVGVNTLTGELSKGLDIFNTKDKGSPNPTRANGDPLFFKGTAEISRLQRVNSLFDLFGSASGQWSANTLLSSEEFGVGGINYGSAYDNSEITGKDGLAGRVELRLNGQTPDFMQSLQPYGFYDIGKVWDPGNAASKDRIRSVASSGAGVRAAFNKNFSGTLELAVPLTRKVQTSGDNDARLFGSVSARF